MASIQGVTSTPTNEERWFEEAAKARSKFLRIAAHDGFSSPNDPTFAKDVVEFARAADRLLASSEMIHFSTSDRNKAKNAIVHGFLAAGDFLTEMNSARKVGLWPKAGSTQMFLQRFNDAMTLGGLFLKAKAAA